MLLPNLISENQSAFVSGRSITENVLVAFEVVHHMRRKNRGCEGEIALKLNISKVYNRVDWSYLKARMQAMGFCKRWIQWIMLYLCTVSYEFYFNGISIGPVCPSRGLRQGFSPYPFLLCLKGLSDVLDKAACEGRFTVRRLAQQLQLLHICYLQMTIFYFLS